MQVELPALIAGGVRRVSTLLRDCRYQSVAQLMSVQWAHDPRRDGPIAQLKARKVDERAPCRAQLGMATEPELIAKEHARAVTLDRLLQRRRPRRLVRQSTSIPRYADRV